MCPFKYLNWTVGVQYRWDKYKNNFLPGFKNNLHDVEYKLSQMI